MLERENEWRAELEASIQSKDARSKLIQEEKEQMIKRVSCAVCAYLSRQKQL